MLRKKAFKSANTVIFTFLFACGIISHSTETADAVRQGISICVQTVIPSLFPFFILSGIIVDTGLATCIGKPVKKIMMPLFGINGAGASALALGLIGGYPIGASCAASLYEKKLCSKTETERLLAFCNNSGPGFIIGVVGAGIFHDVRIGIILYLSHIISCLITGILFRFCKKDKQTNAMHTPPPSVVCSLAASFSNSVKSAIHSCINISAFIICFSVIIRLLNIYNIFNPLSSLFTSAPELARQISVGLLEVTNGLISLPQCSGTISGHIIVSSFLLGWAGLSVHFQTFSMLPSELSLKPYIAGKALHAIISSAVTALILKTNIIKKSLLAFAASGIEKSSVSFANSGLISACAGAFILLTIFLLIIFYELSQNDWKNIRK